MCGIAGFINSEALRSEEARAIISGMTRSLAHRGPDGEGVWRSADGRVNLGHRRLAIIDLSPAGTQPMMSAGGRFVAVFNGEIYNFKALSGELSAHGFQPRGHSDTEVLLAAVEQWGVGGALRRFVGMFAFALWDQQEGVLHLARDRMGEKPLYYGWSGRTFLFGSELKAMAAHPDWGGEIDRDALALFFCHSYIPTPHSIYQGIRKLPPGECLSLAVEKLAPDELPESTAYWSVREAFAHGASQPSAATDGEAVERLEKLLREAVALQMVADVPLGAFLSGGVDSSVVVALMQAQSARRVRTFSIGFLEEEYDEAAHARRVAAHLGTEHTELYVSPADALAVIPKLPQIYDEPFADSSQIPTYLVSQLARRHVTVSLSGDGGDELFAGYPRYFATERIWRKQRRVPSILRRPVAAFLRWPSPARWDRGLGWAAQAALGPSWRGRLGDRMHKLAGLLTFTSSHELYAALVARPLGAGATVRGARLLETRLQIAARLAGGRAGLITGMTGLDLISYLPDDILVKVDRAAMAVSLESRVPLLDHRVVEFAGALPEKFKVRDGRGKWALRQVLYRHVPRELIDRPKMGFGVPIEHWLRGPLRDWGETLLGESRLRAEGFLDPKPIRQMWAEHQAGTRRWHYPLWDALMFQAWLECWRVKGG